MDSLPQYSFTNISGRSLRPRQMEYHRTIPHQIIMGTTSGGIYEVYSDCSRPVRQLANIGVDDNDQVLGLCWFRHHETKYVAGTMGGNVYYGDSTEILDPSVRANGQIRYSRGHLTSLHVNSNDSVLSTSGYNHDICMYDTQTAQIITIYEDAHDGDINITRFAHQSPNLFVSCSLDKSAKLWDMRMKHHRPIYSISTPARLTTIAFHPNDIYFMTSGQDNHVHQYLVLDGRLHHQYKIPQINSDVNFTRSYYTASGAYVVSGASEEDLLSICEVNTGDVIRRIPLYPGRTHDSLYVQSLRGSSTNDLEVTVLVNYAEYGDREMITVVMPENAPPTLHKGGSGTTNPLTVNMQPFATISSVSGAYEAGLLKLHDSIASDSSGLILLALGSTEVSAHRYVLCNRCMKLSEFISHYPEQSVYNFDSMLPCAYGALLPLLVKYLYVDDVSLTDLQPNILATIREKSLSKDIAVIDVLAQLMHISIILELPFLSDILDHIISRYCNEENMNFNCRRNLSIPIVFEAAYLSYVFKRDTLHDICLHYCLRHLHIFEALHPTSPNIRLCNMYQMLFEAPIFDPEQFMNSVRLMALNMRRSLTGDASLETYNMFGLSSLPIIRVGSVINVLDRLLLFIGGHNSMHWYSSKRLLSFDPVTSTWSALPSHGTCPEGLFSITVSPLQNTYITDLLVLCSEKHGRGSTLSVFTLNVATMTWSSPVIDGSPPTLERGSVFSSTAAFYTNDTSDTVPEGDCIGLSYVVAYCGVFNTLWLQDVVVLQPLSASGENEPEYAWSHPKLIGRSPRGMIRNAKVIPIAGKYFPDRCNRVLVIGVAASEYAVLKCHSASLMEWENVEVSGQLGDGRSRACVIQSLGANVIGAILPIPMRMQLGRLEMVRNVLTIRWESALIDIKPSRDITDSLMSCMYKERKLFVCGSLLHDGRTFTEMINLFRLEDNNYSVEITQPHVLITPERQPMLTPLFKSIQDDMLRLLYCRSGVDFRVIVETGLDTGRDVSFHLHRAILKSQWELMNRLLQTASGFREAQEGLMRCSEDLVCMETLLIFVYTGQLCIENTDMISLIQVANKYQLQSLLLACEGVLVQMVDKENCLTLLLWANKFLLKNLANVAIAVYIRNYKDIDINCSVDEETYAYVEGIRMNTNHAYVFDIDNAHLQSGSCENDGAA